MWFFIYHRNFDTLKTKAISGRKHYSLSRSFYPNCFAQTLGLDAGTDTLRKFSVEFRDLSCTWDRLGGPTRSIEE